MRLKIRKLCIYIAFIQILLIVIHVMCYMSVDGLKGLPSMGDNLLFVNHTRAERVKLLTTYNRLLTRKEITERYTNRKQVINKSVVETRQVNRNFSTHRQLEEKVTTKNNKIGNARRTGRPVHAILRKCSDIVFPEYLNQGERWQTIDNRTAFVFSAYLVERGKKLVLTGARTKHRQIYFCIIWKEGHGKYLAEQVIASVKQLPEGKDLRYSAVLFECSLDSYIDIPSHVSLVTNHCASPSNLLKVHMTTTPERYTRRFTVCLAPLNTRYNRAYELIEWIELNRILGAEKFVIYNHSSADNILNVLKFYKKQGLVEVVQWHLPTEERTLNGSYLLEIHYYGQIVALQDCLYRNKVDSEFIVNIDLDEFIIPRGGNVNNWNDMLEPLGNGSGAYIVRSTYFRKEWESVYFNKKEMIDKYGLVTLRKLYHEENIFAAKRRSKYFARTETVFQVMIHNVLYLPRKHIAKTIPIDIGRLHHYRDWENEFELPTIKVFDDTVPRKFGETLLKNVGHVWSKLENVRMNFPANL